MASICEMQSIATTDILTKLDLKPHHKSCASTYQSCNHWFDLRQFIDLRHKWHGNKSPQQDVATSYCWCVSAFVLTYARYKRRSNRCLVICIQYSSYLCSVVSNLIIAHSHQCWIDDFYHCQYCVDQFWKFCIAAIKSSIRFHVDHYDDDYLAWIWHTKRCSFTLLSLTSTDSVTQSKENQIRDWWMCHQDYNYSRQIFCYCCSVPFDN